MRHWLALAFILLMFNAAGVGNAAIRPAPASIGIAGARAGRWIDGLSSLENTGNSPVIVHMEFTVNREPGLVFQRSVLAPADGIIRYSFPLLCPSNIPFNRGIISISSRVAGSNGKAIQGDLFVDHSRLSTAAVIDPDDHGTAAMLSAMRVMIGYKPRLSYAAMTRLPFWPAGYDGLACVALSWRHPRIMPSQIAALRQWVSAGGHLWIQANHTSAAFCRNLLGSAWHITNAGRGRSATFHFTAPHVHRTLKLRHAISFCYLIVRHMKVLEWANGWPAVAEGRFGRGRFFVCAVNARGLLNVAHKPGSVLWPAAGRFFHPRATISARPQLHLAQDGIGYHIESGGVVAGALLGLLAALIAGAIWAGRRNRLEWAAGVLVAGIACTAMLLLTLGMLERGKVSLTRSCAQIERLMPAQHRAMVSGVMAYFSPHQITTRISLNAGTFPQSPSVIASQRRLTIRCGSSGRLELNHFTLVSGAPVALAYQAAESSTLPAVTGRFGSRGLTVNLRPLAGSGLHDMTLAAQNGNLAVRRVASARQIYGDATILPGGQYLSAGLLTGTQLSIAAVYRSIIGYGKKQPVLLCRTTTAAAPLKLTGNPLRRTQTILEMPVSLKPQRAGGRVHIPWPFLGFRLIRGPHQHAISTVYQETRHKWISDLSRPARIYLDFQLPHAEKRLRITRARLTFRLNAPGRPVHVLVRRNNHWRNVQTIQSPAGRISILLSGAQAPQNGPNACAGIGLKIAGGDSMAKPWDIRWVRLAVDGVQP